MQTQGHHGHINRCSSINGSFLRPVTLCFGFLLFQIFLIRKHLFQKHTEVQQRQHCNANIYLLNKDKLYVIHKPDLNPDLKT